MLEADPRGILAVPGHEWAVFRLGLPGSVTEIQVDTNHFKVSDICISRSTARLTYARPTSPTCFVYILSTFFVHLELPLTCLTDLIGFKLET